jgi:hypothetical protein
MPDLTTMASRLATLALLVLAVCAMPARAAGEPQPGALTPEEAAAGWVQLFDGRDFSKLLIEGDAAVVDGVLVLGGATGATLRVNRDLGEDFELVLFYRVEGLGGLNFRAESHGMMSSASSGTSIPAPPALPGAPPAWRELRCRCQRNQAGDGYDIRLEGQAAGGNRDFSTGMGLTVTNPPAVWFEVPAGGKLFLRGAKARPDPAAGRWWNSPWGFAAILGAALAALLVAVLLFARWMRRRAPPLAVPREAPDEERVDPAGEDEP